jgi:hypothetical protein
VLSSWTSWRLKMGPIGCPETSVQKSADLHFLGSEQLHNICLISSLSKHEERLPLSMFVLIPFNFHTPANSSRPTAGKKCE